ncbi:MAG: hypothetical protein ABIM30_00635 [candidate division WOR-3 bacterium]
MLFKKSQTNYAARALEEGIDVAFELYRLKKMKEKLIDKTPNSKLIKEDAVVSKIIPQSTKQKGITAKELVDTFLGATKDEA